MEKRCPRKSKIKQTKELNFNDLMKNPTDAAKVIQILNNDTKRKFREMKLCELGNGKFYQDKDFLKHRVAENAENKQDKLSVWKGYKFSILNVGANNLMMQIDVCCRVLRTINFLETMNGHTKDEVKEIYTGALVVARYGNHKIYKILEVDYGKGPKDTFPDKSTGKDISYEQYFKENYGLKVNNFKQPLIRVEIKKEKVIKNGKMEEKFTYGYLVPEFVSLTGMDDSHRKNFHLMKEVAEHTKMSPFERWDQNDRIIEQINDQPGGMYEIGEAVEMRGWVLKQPQICLRGDSTKNAKDGNLFLKDPVLDAAQFKDWLFVYSTGKDPKFDDQDADYCVDTMKAASKTFGIVVKDPGFITIKGGSNIDQWIREIDRDFKENGKPQIVVLFLTPREEKIYGEMKRYLINELKVPSQVIRRRTVSSKGKSAMSAASKIVLQMNAKLGQPIWKMVRKGNYLKEKRVMYGAISLSKGKGGFTLGFVGTTNDSSSEVFSETKVGIKRKEELPIGLLERIFISWAKSYFIKMGKKAPESIIIYR